MRQWFQNIAEKINSPLINVLRDGKQINHEEYAFEEAHGEIKSGSYRWLPTAQHKAAYDKLFITQHGAITSVVSLGQRLESMGQNARRIAFISSESGIEAASMALMVGRYLAGEKLRTVCVDMAVTNPEISKLIIHDNIGFTDVLANQAEFIDAIYGDDASTLNLIPLGSMQFTAEALFNSSNLEYVIEALSSAYDRVIVDFGALNSRFFAERICEQATTLVLVGSGNARHQNLIDLYSRYVPKYDLDILNVMADATI